MTTTYEPVSDDEAFEQIAVGVHTGLRKGADGPDSHKLWQAIADSQDGSWGDAVRYCLSGLKYQGLAICRVTDS